MAREMEREKQKEREREGDKGGMSVEGPARGRKFKFGSDLGDFTGGETFLSTKEAFTTGPTLGALLTGPKPTLAEIHSLMHDPTFPPTADSKFATLSPEERRKQMSEWADGLPGARMMARKVEREKHKEREREEDKGDVNVEGLIRGGRFNFGYDMGEISLANESEISENHSDTDESPQPTTNPTKDTISSNNNFYNISSHQRRYRLQGHPSSYDDHASSDKKKQAMTKLWLEQNPTLIFRLPSPEEDDDAENPMQARCVASQKGDDVYPPAANRTRVWHVPFPSIEEEDDNDDAAHAVGLIRVQRVASLKEKDDPAPPAADPARVWRVPSPIDDDDEDNGDNNANEAPLPTGPTAANRKRHVRRNPPRVVREVRMGRHIVTSPGDAEWVSEYLIVSRESGVERKGAGAEKKGAGVERKRAGVERKRAVVERKGAGVAKKGAGVVKPVRRGRNAKRISAEVENVACL